MAEYRPLFASTSLLRRGRSQAEQGMLAPTLGAVLLLLFGSAALVAGSLNWQTTSSRGGDAEQAREAAEWGFNTLVDRLNEPGNNYLLVSNWADWEDTADLRTTCGIATDNRGYVPPADLISEIKVVGTRQVRYRLTSFDPPQYPSDTKPPLDKSCNDSFGNLAGGTARLTVVGEVLQDGRVISTHAMERNVTVESVAGVGFGGGAPASPPMTFLATGSGTSSFVALGDTKISDRPEFVFDSNANWKADGGDPRIGQIYCLSSCKGSSNLNDVSKGARPYTLTELITADFLKAFPSAPPYSSELNGLSKLTIGQGHGFSKKQREDLGIDPNGIPESFPYTKSGELFDQCREVTLPPTPAGAGEKAIGCRVRLNIAVKNKTFVVDTSRSNLPVVLYLIGTDEHRIADGGKVVNSQFKSDADAKIKGATSWSKLRIYGDPNLSFLIKPGQSDKDLEQCNNGDTQPITFQKLVYIQGAVIWIPKGVILFVDHEKKWSPALFGTVWTCRITFGKRVTVYNNTDPMDVSKGLDAAFGLVGGAPARYVARGIERTLQSSVQ